MKKSKTQQLITSISKRINNYCEHERCQICFKNHRNKGILKTLNGLEQDLNKLKNMLHTHKFEKKSQYLNNSSERNNKRISQKKIEIISNKSIKLNRTHFGVIDQTDGKRMKQIIYDSQNPQAQIKKSPIKIDYNRLYTKSQSRYKYDSKSPNKYKDQSKSKIGTIVRKDKFIKIFNNTKGLNNFTKKY